MLIVLMGLVSIYMYINGHSQPGLSETVMKADIVGLQYSMY